MAILVIPEVPFVAPQCSGAAYNAWKKYPNLDAHQIKQALQIAATENKNQHAYPVVHPDLTVHNAGLFTNECINIAGIWNFSEKGNVTCISDGNIETQNVSDNGLVTINQNSCSISWAITDSNILRLGIIYGNNIKIFGIFMIPESGVEIIQNNLLGNGTIYDDKIVLSSSGTARGTYMEETEEGEIVIKNFYCTGNFDAVLTRKGSASIQNFLGEGFIKKTSSKFFNKLFKMFTTYYNK